MPWTIEYIKALWLRRAAIVTMTVVVVPLLVIAAVCDLGVNLAKGLGNGFLRWKYDTTESLVPLFGTVIALWKDGH